MPGSTKSFHNNEQIVFTESNHLYVDSQQRRYTSVTTLIGKCFEKFDSEKIAKAKAAREGGDYKELMNQWQQIGKAAANSGTRLHENCENQILGRLELIHKPETPEEQIKFKYASDIVTGLLNDSSNIKFEPEKLIFSPRFLIAGSVDLLVHHDDGTFTIYDWKNVKEIKQNAFMDKVGTIDATAKIPDSNYWHYALQLQLYEIILKIEEYIPKKAKCRRIINAFEKSGFHQYEMPCLVKEACEMIKWNESQK